MKRGEFWVVVICLIVTSLVLASCAASTASNSTATSTATLKSTATTTKTTPAAATKYSVQELNYLTDKEILAVCQKYVTCDGIVLKAVEPDTLAHQGYTWMRKIQITNGGTMVGSGDITAYDTTRYGTIGSNGTAGLGSDGGKVIDNGPSGGFVAFQRGTYAVRVSLSSGSGGAKAAFDIAKLIDDRMK
jgi:hypothetical protein